MTRPHIAAPVVLMAIQGVNELADVEELFTASHQRSLKRQKSHGYESFKILDRVLTAEEIESVRTKIAQKTHDYQKHSINHLILIHSNPHLLRAACTSADETRNHMVTPLFLTNDMSQETAEEMAKLAEMSVNTVWGEEVQLTAFYIINEFINCEKFFQMAKANSTAFFPNTVAMIDNLKLRMLAGAQIEGSWGDHHHYRIRNAELKFKKTAWFISDQAKPLQPEAENFSQQLVVLMRNLFPQIEITDECRRRAASYARRTDEAQRAGLFDAIEAAEPERFGFLPMRAIREEEDEAEENPASPSSVSSPFSKIINQPNLQASFAQTELVWENINVPQIEDLKTVANSLDPEFLKKFSGQDSIKNCLMAIARVAAGNKRESPNENVIISLPELRAAYEKMQQEDLTTLPGAAASEPSCATRTPGAQHFLSTQRVSANSSGRIG